MVSTGARRSGLAALAVGAMVVLASCSGSDGAEAGDVTVAIVADSEVPGPVADLVDEADGVSVASQVSLDGATMAELDGEVDDALADGPDVLVYAGGTNDLPSGPDAVLAGLDERLRAYGDQTCVVVAVPVFRYERGTEAEVAERTAGTRVLEEAVADAGATVVSYLDVSLAMDAAGEDFFAEGELGDLHPGPVAYPRLAEAIAAGVAEAVAASPDGCGTA